VREQRYCDVPMLALRANPYDLLQGDFVAAQINATNGYGTSIISEVNTEGVLVVVPPLKPPTIPRKGWATNENVIEIFYDSIIGTLTGGSEITSYGILWD
jgi:hypothetical protein